MQAIRYVHKLSIIRIGIVLVCFWLAGTLQAAPAAADLLEACEYSLNNNFAGIKGEMCTWYVTPCDCDYGLDAVMPRVCLPEKIPVEDLARTVINGLKEQSELLAEDADFAAATILSRVYPCTE